MSIASAGRERIAVCVAQVTGRECRSGPWAARASARVAALLFAATSLSAAAVPDTVAVPGSPSAMVWPALVVVGFSLMSLLAWVIMRFVGPRPAPGASSGSPGGQDAHETTLLPLAVTRAVGIIENRYADALTVAGLAAEIRVTPDHLERLFQESTGKSVAEYLDSHRMERAVELVKGSGLDISEIQRRVGIADPDRFARLFRATTGMAAADYVREYRGVHRQG